MYVTHICFIHCYSDLLNAPTKTNFDMFQTPQQFPFFPTTVPLHHHRQLTYLSQFTHLSPPFSQENTCHFHHWKSPTNRKHSYPTSSTHHSPPPPKTKFYLNNLHNPKSTTKPTCDFTNLNKNSSPSPHHIICKCKSQTNFSF